MNVSTSLQHTQCQNAKARARDIPSSPLAIQPQVLQNVSMGQYLSETVESNARNFVYIFCASHYSLLTLVRPVAR
eukprot:384035-Amphidinium_carterae.1